MSRLATALALELRVERRYRIAVVAVVMTIGWTLVLLAMPAWLARVAGPFVLLVDTATFGAFFIAALFLFERGEGALAALSVSPLRFAEYLGVKVGALTGLSVASAVPIWLAAGRGHSVLGLGSTLLGVALLAVLFLVFNFALVVRQRSLTGFLAVAPLPLIPLIAVPLARLAGFADHPAFFVVPTTGAAELIRLGLDAPVPIAPGWIVAAVGYLVLAIGIAALAAKWSFEREFTQPGRQHAPRERSRPVRRPSGWLAALVQIDIRTTVRSALLAVVLIGPILLAVAIRLGYPPLTRYLATEFGVELAPYQPVVLAALVVLHVPMMMGMVGALLVLDDIDDRKLLLLRVSPVTAPRYLAYRAVSVAVLAFLGLLAAVPISGLVAWDVALLPAFALAAAQASVLTLATAAFARNKVEGLALLKLLAAVPTAIAPAMWWLPDPVHWLLGLLPPYWAVDILWRPNVIGVGVGAVLTAFVIALLARRTLNRVSGQ